MGTPAALEDGSQGAAADGGELVVLAADAEAGERLCGQLAGLLAGTAWRVCSDPGGGIAIAPSTVALVAAAPFDESTVRRLAAARRRSAGPAVVAVIPANDAGARSAAAMLGVDECLTLDDLAHPLAGRLLARLLGEQRSDAERRFLEARAAEAREWFAGLVERAAEGLLIVDAGGTVQLCNAKAEALLARPPGSLMGSALGQPLSGDGPIELDVASPGVGRRSVEMRLTPARWQGKFAQLVTLRDITADGPTEPAAETYRAFGRTLMATMVDAMLAVDADGRIVAANPAAERLFQAEPARLVGLAAKRLLDPRHDLGADSGFLDAYRVAGDPDDLGRRREMGVVGLAGRALPVEIAVSEIPPFDPDPSAPARPLVMAIITDITERKAGELALLAAKREAEIASRAKSDFLASMTHELRTPLNAIIGFAEMIEGRMLGDALTPRYCEYARDIRQSGELLLEIIADILDMAKIEAGCYELAEGIVDIRRIITDDVRMLRMRADERAIQVALELPSVLPMLRADERAVRQALLNLLSNAVKFTGAGGSVTVRAGVVDGGLRVDVADTGRGMSATDIEKAFQPFVQVRPSDGVRHEGTGLGLPITKAFMELHGGRVALVSRPGTGTTACLEFPADRVVSTIGPSGG